MNEPIEKRSVRIPILVTPSSAEAIDVWRARQRPIPPRSEALRFLALTLLASDPAYDPDAEVEFTPEGEPPGRKTRRTEGGK